MGDSASALGRHLRREAGLPELVATDAELLTRFTQERDEAAFTELVRRYGPLVLGVCRRIAGPDADDAFQATFLVLAKKAEHLLNRPAVSGWLYGVAHRAARKARATAVRHRAKEAAAARPEGWAAEEPPDALAVIEQELRALPRRYREPLVLCALCGRARKEVAAELGVAEGTLSSRLAKAREVLAGRLRRRGVVVPAAALLAAGAAGGAAVPPELAGQAIKVATGTVPVAVGRLASEVTRAMLLNKLLVLVLVAAGATACAAGLLARASSDTPTADAPVPGAAAADGQSGLKVKELHQKVAAAKKDLAGVWEFQKQFVDEKETGERFEYYRYTFTERAMQLEFKHKSRDGNEVAAVVEFSYTINPTTNPPQLSLYKQDALLMCIYELDGDTLKVGRHGSSDVERPRGFALKDKRVADLPLTVWVFKRSDAKPPVPNAGNPPPATGR